MIGVIFCVLIAWAAALLGLAAARVGRWVHASLCGVCCLLAVYAALLLGLPIEAVAAMAVAVPPFTTAGFIPGPAADTTPPRSWTVSLPAGMQLLNSNDRLHHAPKARITAALRAAGKEAAETAGVPALQRAHVYGILCPGDRRRRDPGNWYPSFKATIDGLVDAGILPDDDDAHLVGPDMRLGPVVRHGQIRLLVIELGPIEAVAR